MCPSTAFNKNDVHTPTRESSSALKQGEDASASKVWTQGPSPSCPSARTSQDDVATAATVTAIGASKLLAWLAVEAARAVPAASPVDEHPATVHEVPLLRRAQHAPGLSTVPPVPIPAAL